MHAPISEHAPEFKYKHLHHEMSTQMNLNKVNKTHIALMHVTKTDYKVTVLLYICHNFILKTIVVYYSLCIRKIIDFQLSMKICKFEYRHMCL